MVVSVWRAALVAATGWGGDHYRIYTNGTEILFLYVFVGDTPRDATELAGSLVSSVAFKRPLETKMLAKISGILAWLLLGYLVVRFADVIVRGLPVAIGLQVPSSS